MKPTNASPLSNHKIQPPSSDAASYHDPIIVAEIGCNHRGDFSTAQAMIQIAKQSGAHWVKFQKRHNRTLLPPHQYNAPHPNPSHAYGDTYGAHREFLEFTIDQHRDLFHYCQSVGIGYSCSVWDHQSAIEMATLNPQFIKVPSAANTHLGMLSHLRDHYSGDVHLSVGMTTDEELDAVLTLFEEKNQAHRLVVYSCTSGYPVPFEDVCLLEISRLTQRIGHRVQSIGFSGHHLGIAIDIAAYTLGAQWIERHFTLDRTWKGTDHAASLEPTGLSKLCRDLSATHRALSYKQTPLLPIELAQHQKLKYRPRDA